MGELKYMDKSDEEFIKNLTFSWEKKGIEKEKRKIALKMLKEGLPIETITKVTHLKL